MWTLKFVLIPLRLSLLHVVGFTCTTPCITRTGTHTDKGQRAGSTYTGSCPTHYRGIFLNTRNAALSSACDCVNQLFPCNLSSSDQLNATNDVFKASHDLVAMGLHQSCSQQALCQWQPFRCEFPVLRPCSSLIGLRNCLAELC